jgi:peroxiredoxin
MKSSSSRKWRGYALNALVLVVIVVGIRTWQQRDMVNGAAPALQGVTLNGTPYLLPAHPPRPVLVHFWATWCPICRTEQGSIAAIAHDRSDTITIAMQSGSTEKVSSYMREQAIDFPVLNDTDGSVSRAWGVQAVPASFIIDTDGQIHFIEVGYTTELGIRMRLWLAAL